MRRRSEEGDGHIFVALKPSSVRTEREGEEEEEEEEAIAAVNIRHKKSVVAKYPKWS